MQPDPGTQRPSLAGFGEAQDRKRALTGSDITFIWPAVVTFPPGTPTSPETGLPFDPTVVPTASSQASAVVRCGVFFKAVNRGGAANAEVAAPIGRAERTRIFLTVNQADAATIAGASDFVWNHARYRIDVVKPDEIVLGYRRMLVYGAAEGTAG